MTTNKDYVNGEIPFQIPTRSFSIGESTTGYALYSSVDCKSETDSEAHWAQYGNASIPANKQHDVIFVPSGRWWKLVGNVGTVSVRY